MPCSPWRPDVEASRALPPDDPDPATPGAPGGARQHHALLSIVELTGTLSRARDVHAIVDALLLNLMGHFGTARSAVWLSGPTPEAPPVLLRRHGIGQPLMTVLVTTAWAELEQKLMTDREPVQVAEIWEGVGLHDRKLAAEAGVELVIPLRVEARFLGVVLLGPRLGRKPYGGFDLEMIRTSAAMAGLAIHNADLQARALESNRRQRLALQELAKLNTMKTEFVANLNHELRTPLSLVQASLECLTGAAPGSEQAKSLLELSQRGVQNLSRVIQQLLTFSDSSRRNLEVNPVEQDLEAYLAAFVEERRPGVSAGLRELIFQSSRDKRPAIIDGVLLNHVLNELIDNAVKFSAPGTHVQVSLADHVEHGSSWRRIEVRDDGPGIAPEYLPGLFDEFRQGDGSSTRAAGGLGIGLALARKLTESMSGRITVESVPGEGTVFVLLLPAA